jgi:hypothetical protein
MDGKCGGLGKIHGKSHGFYDALWEINGKSYETYG